MASPTFSLLLLLAFAHLLPAASLNIVEVASCAHLLTYLRSCSESLSLVIIQDIDCSSLIQQSPIIVSGECVISGSLLGAAHAPLVDWGENRELLQVQSGSSIMLENLHMRFDAPQERVDASGLAPVFWMGNRSRLLLTSMVTSFSTCGGLDAHMESSFSLHSRRIDPGLGNFYFANRSTVMQENGASSVICHLGVHCGAGGVSSVLQSFVEQVTQEDVLGRCASSHVRIDPPVETEMKGVWVTIGLGATIVVLLILLALVRKEITDRMVRQKNSFGIASTRQMLTRSFQQDSPSFHFQQQDVQQLYEGKGVKDMGFRFSDDVHVNPLYCATDEFLMSNPQGKVPGLLVEGTPFGLTAKSEGKAAQSAGDSEIHVPMCGLKIHEGLRMALGCQNVVLHLDSSVLGHNISSAMVKGSFSGELVAVGIYEHDSETSEKFCKRALHLSRLVHPNVLRIYFALEEDHAIEDLSQKDRMPGDNPEDHSWDGFRDSGLLVQSALVMELCDLGSLIEVPKDVLSFLYGWWEMPKLTLALLTALDIAEAIGFLHDRGSVHGNLKLETVYLKSEQQDPRGFVCKVDNLRSADDEDCLSHGQAVDVRAFGHLMLSLLSMGEELTQAFGIPQALLTLLWSCCDDGAPSQLGFQTICEELKGMLSTISTRRHS